ncbi:hypothetical protein ZIOFF_042385 [Zingiber officinale]|uniref:PORR domain-containing protein n=1 Tax=Zingiber officinale TaxID=94328 RepID=A0A8J5FTC3_ZINOF|nr:hypothetical protein ZIOFF_042385 [Zingiber officinale]
MLAFSPSSSSSPNSIRPPQELQGEREVRPPQEEERERMMMAGHTKEQKRERNNRGVHHSAFMEMPGCEFFHMRGSPEPNFRHSPRADFRFDFSSLERHVHSSQHVPHLSQFLMMKNHPNCSIGQTLPSRVFFGFDFTFGGVLITKITGLRRRLQRPPPCDKPFIELVSWDNDYAKSVIERRAEEEARLTGVRMRPNFDVCLPPGFYLKREMRDWTRDWLELPYISPYASTSELHPASPELEKRTVGVLHEVLSLTLLKRMAVPIIGKFSEEFQFSNAFSNAFTRHPGIFYLSLKGGIKTAMLREAYNQGELVDRDPLLEIKDQFEEMLDEGHREYLEKLKSKKEAMKRDLELMARKNAELPEDETAEI